MNNVIPIVQLEKQSLLSKTEQATISRICEHYAEPQAGAIDALLAIQSTRGWISDALLYAIAAQLKMSAAELESVATFYNLIYRQPVGTHVIHVCDSISCWLMDYQKIVDKLKSELHIDLGETTSDGKITLLPNVCLGCCDKAPAMMIDGELVTDVTADKVDTLLNTLKQLPHRRWEGENG